MFIIKLKQLLALALSAAMLVGGVAKAAVVDIDNAELARLMASGVPLIDIRTAPEWQQSGIVPGSHLLTFFDERGQANPGSWLAAAKRIAGSNDPVILICRSGNRTRTVSQFLSEQAGYRTVYNVRSGIAAWARESRTLVPVTSAQASCPPGKAC